MNHKSPLPHPPTLVLQKYLRAILTGMCLVWMCLPAAFAQKGLNIERILKDNSYKDNNNAVVIIVKGKKLKPYNLTYFHSVTLNNLPKDANRFEEAVRNDEPQATRVEEMKAGNNLVSCYYQLPPLKEEEDSPNRFILFRRTGKGDATLIYLEGQTQLDALIKEFIHKKK